MSTYAGQNIGAGKPERIGKGLKAGMFIGSIYSVLALGITLLFGKSLVHLFVEGSQEVIINQAYQYMLVNALFLSPDRRQCNPAFDSGYGLQQTGHVRRCV